MLSYFTYIIFFDSFYREDSKKLTEKSTFIWNFDSKPIFLTTINYFLKKQNFSMLPRMVLNFWLSPLHQLYFLCISEYSELKEESVVGSEYCHTG